MGRPLKYKVNNIKLHLRDHRLGQTLQGMGDNVVLKPAFLIRGQNEQIRSDSVHNILPGYRQWLSTAEAEASSCCF